MKTTSLDLVDRFFANLAMALELPAEQVPRLRELIGREISSMYTNLSQELTTYHEREANRLRTLALEAHDIAVAQLNHLDRNAEAKAVRLAQIRKALFPQPVTLADAIPTAESTLPSIQNEPIEPTPMEIPTSKVFEV